jgi:hypothetical protein
VSITNGPWVITSHSKNVSLAFNTVKGSRRMADRIAMRRIFGQCYGQGHPPQWLVFDLRPFRVVFMVGRVLLSSSVSPWVSFHRCPVHRVYTYISRRYIKHFPPSCHVFWKIFVIISWFMWRLLNASALYLGGVRETTTYLIQHNRPLGWYSNPGPPEYEVWVLTTVLELPV